MLNDILVGDVWVASGQSNMEFPMTEAWSTRKPKSPRRNIPRFACSWWSTSPLTIRSENVDSQRLGRVHSGNRGRLFRRRLFFRAQSAAENGRSHRPGRIVLGRNRRRVVDEPALARRPMLRSCRFSRREQKRSMSRNRRPVAAATRRARVSTGAAQAKAEGKPVPWPAMAP